MDEEDLRGRESRIKVQRLVGVCVSAEGKTTGVEHG